MEATEQIELARQRCIDAASALAGVEADIRTDEILSSKTARNIASRARLEYYQREKEEADLAYLLLVHGS